MAMLLSSTNSWGTHIEGHWISLQSGSVDGLICWLNEFGNSHKRQNLFVHASGP